MGEIVLANSKFCSDFDSAVNYSGRPSGHGPCHTPGGGSVGTSSAGRPFKADNKSPDHHMGVGDTFQSQRAKARKGVS